MTKIVAQRMAPRMLSGTKRDGGMAGADQHRADDAEAVHKAHPDNEQHRVAGDQPSGARDALFLPFEPRDDPAFEPAADEVQQLIPSVPPSATTAITHGQCSSPSWAAMPPSSVMVSPSASSR